MSFRHSKIVCTIGPASKSRRIVEKLLRAGMDVARLNFSHGKHEDHAANIALLRAAALEQAAAAVLSEHHVAGLLRVQIATQTRTRTVRAYGTRPARTEDRHTFALSVTVDAEAVDAAVQRLGWRVYATNQPAETLSAEQAVLAYREEYLVERGFCRLKGRSLTPSPLYL